jgi:hypothetical protein
MSVALCIAAAIAAYCAGRRSLVTGLLTVFGIGYVYGILRANLQSPAIYILFDSAVIGLYAAQFSTIKQQFLSEDGRRLKHWVLLLTIWPVILFFIPLQDPMVQVVGLRGTIFFLPMMLLGARLTREKLYPLALGLAALNIPALVLAIAEYTLGIERFFPRNVLTELIYSSNDVGSLDAYRIPSSFPNAHAYAGTMVMTLPLLLGAWVQHHPRRSHQLLLMAGIISAVLGVFVSAVRSHFIVMIVVLGVFILSARVRPGLKLIFTMSLIAVGLLVAQQDRLQRFATLRDTHYVERRVHSSVNASFLDALQQFPFGNGLGGGGTSIPAFLHDRLHAPLLIENEYGRALLETGVIGLASWISFVLWFVTRRNHAGRDPWMVGRRLAWYACVCCFAHGLVGVGLLLSIPQSVIMLTSVGWVSIPQNDHPVLRPMPFKRARFIAPRIKELA